MDGMTTAEFIVDRRMLARNHRDRLRQRLLAGVGSTLTCEMSTPHPAPEHDANLELPVEELLRRATVHPPYGVQVIDDLPPEEADAFLDAVLN